jgi:hypothetical protein
MDDGQLERSLQSTGKTTFVKYVDSFSDDSLSNDFLVDILMKNENYTESSSRTKVSEARRIIRSGRKKDALRNISQSTKLDRELRDQALSLLNDTPTLLSPGRSSPPPPRRAPESLRIASSWPEWKLPDNEELLQLAKITIPYIRFLHPDVVREVVEDNERRRKGWHDRLAEHHIEPSLYLWERSPSVFPGVRRYAGATEIAQYRRKRAVTAAGFTNALDVDDNDHPKAIWSFIFRGKPFQNLGPPGYSLAHLADHKHHKDRGQREFDYRNTPAQPWQTLFGLFTSAANAVYTPDHLMRPTDFSFPLRNLIQRKAADLYGSFCNLLPPLWSIRANESAAWSVDAFDWCKPVGTSEHVPAFLKYRNEEMENLLSEEYLSKAYRVDRSGGD